MRKSIKLLAGILVLIMLVSGIVSMTVIAVSNNDGIDTDSAASSKDDGKLNKEKLNGGKNKGVHVDVLSVAASVLEMDKSDVKEAVRDGKVGDLLIAADKVDEFKAVYLTELKAKLDTAVENGTITQEKADEKYEAGKTKMDEYDGTTHLCGHDDHSKMFEKKEKKSSETENHSA